MTTGPLSLDSEKDSHDDAFPPAEALSYEEARQELEETVRILEAGQMSLDDSLTFWERGEALARRCEELLDGATQRVEKALESRSDAETAPASETTEDAPGAELDATDDPES